MDNFYNNAFEHGAKFIQYNFVNENELLISSDSQKIPEDLYDKVFELGFSTKDKGTGIGLDQIKGFLSKSKYSIKIENNESLVTFKIYRG
ncbi:hypothetical protein RMB13_14355 [Acinetobacter sp. V102_4]|uniref:GHKL domain-containing protein n=1 Tax=Acinetobacter sp. V102_4 TaxID=3072984 RepID=UPI00287D214F|nr:GHKL domain-containing protein [Acinetobacter sp. V102_4]MDS7930632.1 hypothetical protein [Acinetobacter sp. V102_4]